MEFLGRFTLQTANLATLGRFARALVCVFAAWKAFDLFDASGDISIASGARQPFALSMSFLTFAFCSTLFWHSALLSLITGTYRPVWRAPLLRSFDYVWYGAALASAVLIVNELQLAELNRQRESIDSNIEYNIELARTYNADLRDKHCTFLLNSLTPQDEEEFGVTLMYLNGLCARNLREDEGRSAFVSICEDAGMVRHENDARFYSSLKMNPKRDALNDLSTICTVYHDRDAYPKERDELDSLIDETSLLPGQKSGLWLYILAVVIGLRLTRTTAEFADALSDARR